jgi:hypothetical protein
METIKLSDRQTVYLTANAASVKSGARKVGTPVSRHPKQAEALIKSGKATAKLDKSSKSEA